MRGRAIGKNAFGNARSGYALVLVGVYSVRDAARILKVTPARLRYWKRTQLVRSHEGDEQGFAFQDLVYVRAVLALLDGGVPLRRIRQSLEILRAQVPELKQPLSALRIWGHGPKRVVVRHEGKLLELDGQLVLEFEQQQDRAEPGQVAPLRLRSDAAGEREDEKAASEVGALDWFEIGCGFDSDPATYDKAIAAYRSAVELDPDFADAHCNLGAALYNKGDRKQARIYFEQCLELHPNHVEARFNLANLVDECGDARAALEHYLVALRGDPFYADLHINLALLYEKLGRGAEGLQHWRRYLQIEPDGALSDIARQRVRS